MNPFGNVCCSNKSSFCMCANIFDKVSAQPHCLCDAIFRYFHMEHYQNNLSWTPSDERDRQHSQLSSHQPLTGQASQQQVQQQQFSQHSSTSLPTAKKQKRSRGNRAEQHFRRRLRTKDLDEPQRLALTSLRCQRNDEKQIKASECDHAMILDEDLADQVVMTRLKYRCIIELRMFSITLLVSFV